MGCDRRIQSSEDVFDAIRLLEAIAPLIDVPVALYRGRYGTPVARIEATGIPISAPSFGRIREQLAGAADVLHPAR